MSAILLSNPYVPPTQAAQQTVAEPQTALAIAPAADTSGSAASGDATDFSGSGSGYAGGPGQQALFEEAMGRLDTSGDRPAEATPASIVNAKAAQTPNPLGTNLPEVAPPNPLPTSPILQRMSEDS